MRTPRGPTGNPGAIDPAGGGIVLPATGNSVYSARPRGLAGVTSHCTTAQLVHVLEERQRRDLDRLAVGREDVDGVEDVLKREPVFHRQHALVNHLRCQGREDVDAKDLVARGLPDDLPEAARALPHDGLRPLPPGTATPAAGRLSASVFGVRPVATRSTSASNVLFLPRTLAVTTFVPFLFATETSSAPVWIPTPSSRRYRSRSCETSGSSSGTIRSLRWRTVTCVPSRWYICANSSPSARPPRTMRESGRSLGESASTFVT